MSTLIGTFLKFRATSLDFQILRQELTQAEAALELNRSEAWPNIEIAGGTQRFKESGDNAFFAELSLPSTDIRP